MNAVTLHPSILRAYDIRGIYDQTLSPRTQRQSAALSPPALPASLWETRLLLAVMVASHPRSLPPP